MSIVHSQLSIVVAGRFTQEDTYHGDGMNRSAYCGNDPVNWVDPSGNYRHWINYINRGSFREYSVNGSHGSRKRGVEMVSIIKRSPILRSIIITLVACFVFLFIIPTVIRFHLFPNSTVFDSLIYYKKISYTFKRNIQLSQIFDDFDWDKAYIQNNANEDSFSLDEKLGFETNLSALDTWYGVPGRVVFVSGEEVVFEFEYDNRYIDFTKKNVFIYPDTVVKRKRIWLLWIWKINLDNT